jgi:hypothetical protein
VTKIDFVVEVVHALKAYSTSDLASGGALVPEQGPMKKRKRRRRNVSNSKQKIDNPGMPITGQSTPVGGGSTEVSPGDRDTMGAIIPWVNEIGARLMTPPRDEQNSSQHVQREMPGDYSEAPSVVADRARKADTFVGELTSRFELEKSAPVRDQLSDNEKFEQELAMSSLGGTGSRLYA